MFWKVSLISRNMRKISAVSSEYWEFAWDSFLLLEGLLATWNYKRIENTRCEDVYEIICYFDRADHRLIYDCISVADDLRRRTAIDTTSKMIQSLYDNDQWTQQAHFCEWLFSNFWQDSLEKCFLILQYISRSKSICQYQLMLISWEYS